MASSLLLTVGASLYFVVLFSVNFYTNFRIDIWHRTKYISLDAISYFFLALIINAPKDLSTSMTESLEQSLKLTGSTLVCIVMANSMPSLCRMDNTTIIFNVSALVIVIVTLIFDLVIMFKTNIIYSYWREQILVMAIMFLQLLFIVSTAVVVPTIKILMERQFQATEASDNRQVPGQKERSRMSKIEENITQLQEKHGKQSGVMLVGQKEKNYESKIEENFVDKEGEIYVCDMKTNLVKYLLMTHSSSPQNVVARSPLCFSSDVLCLVAFFVTSLAVTRSSDKEVPLVAIQMLAILLGSTIPASRCMWWSDVVFKKYSFRTDWIDLTKNIIYSCDWFKVEEYWLSGLVKWKEAPIRVDFQRIWIIKIIRFVKRAGSVVVRLQMVIVIVSKLIRACIVTPMLMIRYLFFYIKMLMIRYLFFNDERKMLMYIFVLLPMFSISILLFSITANVVVCLWFCYILILTRRSTSTLSVEQIIHYLNDKQQKPSINSSYVLHLEGETEFIHFYTEGSHYEGDTAAFLKMKVKLKQKRMEKTGFLKALIESHSTLTEGFQSFSDFRYMLRCSWELLLVTLSTIAVALPNVDREQVDLLLSGVNQGLRYVRLIDKRLNERPSINMRDSAKSIWRGIFFKKKWLDLDLQTFFHSKEQDAEVVVLKLSKIALTHIQEFDIAEIDAWDGVHLYPPMVLAANCMRDVCSMILLRHYQDEMRLFEWLRSSISDILGACLTNLPDIINMEYSKKFIEDREEIVWNATHLFIETEELLELLYNNVPCTIGGLAGVFRMDGLEEYNQARGRKRPLDSDSVSGDVVPVCTPLIGASVISITLRPLVDKAAEVAMDYCDISVNIEREMSSLRRVLCIIEKALPEAKEKTVDNPTICAWLRYLDDICYEIRDVLDEFVTVAASTRARKASQPVTSNSLLSSLSSAWKNISETISEVISMRPIQLTNKISSLRGRLDKMKEDMETAKILTFVNVGDSQNAPTIPETTGPFLDKQRDVFVGRELEKKGIMEKLLNYNNHDVHVVLIWGMGGVGKTTLARSIYNDEGVTEEQYPTENRRWLHVGVKEFDAKEIILRIIGRSHESGKDDVEVYQKKLIEKLKGKRFLIVLDDIWNIGKSQWKLFWAPLTNIGKGGVVIITARTTEVITTTETPVSNDVGPLSDQHCWQIFKSRAFINGNSRSDLERIGKQIVMKFKGLPLAAEVVGCSLSNDLDVKNWRNFLEALNTQDNVIMQALRWCYNRLSPHLQLCFEYCSLFPKDHEFDEKMLVEMWMAHDFILNDERDRRRPEDIGASYFKQLVNGSFFQCVDGKYVMHDMIHDLAMLVSSKKIIRTNGLMSINDQMENVRHMCITYDSYFWQNLSLCNTERLCTLCILHDNSTCVDPKTVQDIFERLKSIRVLVLVSNQITCIPECIRKLIHLRYLDISKTCVSTIPDALCDLYNLQTLAVPCGHSRAVLPKSIVNMSNMRHLRACLHTCNGVKNLTSLQELYSISVCKGDDISELGDLRELRGKLIIEDLENVTGFEDASQARMKEKNYIDHLELKFMSGFGDQINVLNALECPPYLTNLEIDGYKGLTSPSWMKDGNFIAYLQSLDLSRCNRLESLPPLGQLNSLKHLHFHRLDAIQKLDDEFYGKRFNENVFFPSLESLKLAFMSNLEGWDDIVIRDNSVMCFPCLTSLFIRQCPNLVSALPRIASNMNIMRKLSNLEIRDCSGLVVLKLDGLVSLKHLKIWRCSNLTCVTSVELPSMPCCLSVKTLIVFSCDMLTYFPRLVAIEELRIKRCNRLSSLSISLQRLNCLDVHDCLMLEPMFEDEPTSPSSSMSSSLPQSRFEILQTDNVHVLSKLFQHDLVFLKEMDIGMFSNVRCFDETVENNWHKLTSLETLEISDCADLESLPPDTKQLSSLKKLCLSYCPNLRALPDGGLPLSLEVLEIKECSLLLYERCQAESGLDWHKIKHIRERKIIRPEE